MNMQTLEKQFKTAVSSEIELAKDSIDRYQIFTPFQFDDGDHYVTVLKKCGDKWRVTDEAHTLMHLSFSKDVDGLYNPGKRCDLFKSVLIEYGTTENDGELYIEISDDNSYGNALFNLIQVISKIQCA